MDILGIISVRTQSNSWLQYLVIFGLFSACYAFHRLLALYLNRPYARFRKQLRLMFGISSKETASQLYEKHKQKIKINLNDEMNLLKILCVEPLIVQSLFDYTNDHTKSEVKLLDTLERLIIKCFTIDDERAICMTIAAISDGLFEKGLNECVQTYKNHSIDFTKQSPIDMSNLSIISINNIDNAFSVFVEALQMCTRHDKRHLAQRILILLDSTTLPGSFLCSTSLNKDRVCSKVQYLVESNLKCYSHNINTLMYKIMRSRIYYWEYARYIILSRFDGGDSILRLYHDNWVDLPLLDHDVRLDQELDQFFDVFRDGMYCEFKYKTHDHWFLDFAIEYDRMKGYLIEERYQSEMRIRIALLQRYGIMGLQKYEKANRLNQWTPGICKRCSLRIRQEILFNDLSIYHFLPPYEPRVIYPSSEMSISDINAWLKITLGV